MLPPLVEILRARPRRRMNQRTTVELHGTKAALMPMAAMSPRLTYSCHSSRTWLVSRIPPPSRHPPLRITTRGPQRSVAQPLAAPRALYRNTYRA